jgi:hypothetical protein
MHTELLSRWEQLQASKQALESAIANSTCDAHFQPADGWSIAQVVEHLIASEGGTLGYMKKKSSGGWDALEEATAEHHEKSRAINARLESDERYKAPDVLPEPGNSTSLQDLLQKWNALRRELEAFLVTLDVTHFNKLVFRQPSAGMLTILHALEFMDAHLRHHLPQINRIQQS